MCKTEENWVFRCGIFAKRFYRRTIGGMLRRTKILDGYKEQILLPAEYFWYTFCKLFMACPPLRVSGRLRQCKYSLGAHRYGEERRHFARINIKWRHLSAYRFPRRTTIGYISQYLVCREIDYPNRWRRYLRGSSFGGFDLPAIQISGMLG